MKKKNEKKLPIFLSLCITLLGIAQWFDPSESSARWSWLQNLTNNIFGYKGYAKFLILLGGIWFACIFVPIGKTSKKD